MGDGKVPLQDGIRSATLSLQASEYKLVQRPDRVILWHMRAKQLVAHRTDRRVGDAMESRHHHLHWMARVDDERVVIPWKSWHRPIGVLRIELAQRPSREPDRPKEPVERSIVAVSDREVRASQPVVGTVKHFPAQHTVAPGPTLVLGKLRGECLLEGHGFPVVRIPRAVDVYRCLANVLLGVLVCPAHLLVQRDLT